MNVDLILRKTEPSLWIGYAVKPTTGACKRVGTWDEPFKSNSYGEKAISATENTVVYKAGPATSKKGNQYERKSDWLFVLVRFRNPLSGERGK